MITEKVKIEKNTVQETLIIPLYARKLCTKRFPQLFQDKASVELLEHLDYDFSGLEKQSESLMQVFGALEVAMRQNDLAWEVKDYLKLHPYAAVVNLGCGLDQTGRNCDNGTCRIYNLDLPDVIRVRNQLIPVGQREENIAADLTDFSWFDKIDASEGAVFFAAGVFYYFQKSMVKKLVTAMAEKFSGGRIAFDACGKTGLKMMLKTWIKQAEIQDVGAYFYVSDAVSELSRWSPSLQVSSRGYMFGYFPMGDFGIKGIHRLLAQIGDGAMKMQIVKVDFLT